MLVLIIGAGIRFGATSIVPNPPRFDYLYESKAGDRVLAVGHRDGWIYDANGRLLSEVQPPGNSDLLGISGDAVLAGFESVLDLRGGSPVDDRLPIYYEGHTVRRLSAGTLVDEGSGQPLLLSASGRLAFFPAGGRVVIVRHALADPLTEMYDGAVTRAEVREISTGRIISSCVLNSGAREPGLAIMIAGDSGAVDQNGQLWLLARADQFEPARLMGLPRIQPGVELEDGQVYEEDAVAVADLVRGVARPIALVKRTFYPGGMALPNFYEVARLDGGRRIGVADYSRILIFDVATKKLVGPPSALVSR
jgi:hypothetical protein